VLGSLGGQEARLCDGQRPRAALDHPRHQVSALTIRQPQSAGAKMTKVGFFVRSDFCPVSQLPTGPALVIFHYPFSPIPVTAKIWADNEFEIAIDTSEITANLFVIQTVLSVLTVGLLRCTRGSVR